MSRVDVLPGIEPGTAYQGSPLHSQSCVWVEKNCYIDVWIEVLHALGLEPLAVMPFTLAVDFEGDQWTFFKPVHSELEHAYGLDVQELNVWRPLLEHALEHLGAGKLISTEADAFWLPDTAGTDYRRQHTKTTIVLSAVDTDTQSARYFHNAGFHELQGEDFRALFRLQPEGRSPTPGAHTEAPGSSKQVPDSPAPGHDGHYAGPVPLPLFAELMRVDRLQRRPLPELRALSRQWRLRHLARRPADNPVRRFAARMASEAAQADPGSLATAHSLGATRQGLDHYHAWAFATLRQLGSAFELASACLRWQADGTPDVSAAEVTCLRHAADSFDILATTSKTLILKGARAAFAKKAWLAPEQLEQMAQAWDQGMQALRAL